MTNNLMPSAMTASDFNREADKHLVLYKKMAGAIASCHNVDECKDIADRAVALAAYYKQIKDDETVRKFKEVKLRSWRRIGQLLSAIDVSGCQTQTQKIKKIRDEYPDPVLKDISDHYILQSIQLAQVPDRGFEEELDAVDGSADSMIRRGHPAKIAEREENRRRQEEHRRWYEANKEEIDNQERQRQRQLQEAGKAKQLQERQTNSLVLARSEAMEEVGVTLERKDRERMKDVVFLIREEIHETLRKAAFDHRVTMQEILRRGLAMWFAANGYDVSVGHLDLRAPKSGKR